MAERTMINPVKNKKQNLLQSLQDYGAIAVKINRRTAKLSSDTEQAFR